MSYVERALKVMLEGLGLTPSGSGSEDLGILEAEILRLRAKVAEQASEPLQPGEFVEVPVTRRDPEHIRGVVASLRAQAARCLTDAAALEDSLPAEDSPEDSPAAQPANPVHIGRVAEHGPDWVWLRLDRPAEVLRRGDRIRVRPVSEEWPFRRGTSVVLGVMGAVVHLERAAWIDIVAIADMDQVYLVGRDPPT